MRRFEIDIEDHDFNLLAGRHDLAGVDVLLGPAHLRHVDKTFDAAEFNECTVVGGHAAFELRADRELALDAFPRIRLQLLHAERDTLCLRVEADVVPRRSPIAGLPTDGHTLPGDVGHMQQAVNAAKIDEGAVIGDVLDHALEDLTFLEVRYQLRRASAALLQNGPARHDDVAAAVDLEDLEGLRVPMSGPRSWTGRMSTWSREEGGGADRSTKPP